jgi:Flp pilus assembly pilin Flp
VVVFRRLTASILTFRREDRAQDLVEYTLLIGFVCLAVAGVIYQTGKNIQGPWAAGNVTLTTAQSTAAAGDAGVGGSGGGDGQGHGDGDGH